MPVLELTFERLDPSLSVRRFAVREAISTLFSVTVWARSPDPSLDLSALVGAPATFAAFAVDPDHALSSEGGARRFSGLVRHMELAEVEPRGLSLYEIHLVPALWLLTQRRNNRVFQHLAIPDILGALLSEWGLEHAWEIDRGRYPRLEYKVQYGETDFDFFSRLLEEAGVAYVFPEDGGGSRLLLSDRLTEQAARQAPIPYASSLSVPEPEGEVERVTRASLAHEVRPGAYTLRDVDFRSPAVAVTGEAPRASAPEDRYEVYRYQPGGALAETGRPGGTPVADAKGVARGDAAYAQGRAARALEGERAGRRAIGFSTNAADLRPGTVFSMSGHPHPDLAGAPRLLVTALSLEGTHDEVWQTTGRAVLAEAPYAPPLRAPKPRIHGVQSARVVGPPGQEIHTDELGRVRVHFPWDRAGTRDPEASMWIRVSHGWAGAGHGLLALPRVGQEVLVTFLEGDPDQPVVLGRAHNAIEPAPYGLPGSKAISAWKSESSPGGGGFNEIKLDDAGGEELFTLQAEKNLRSLVKNDETITVGRDRKKQVMASETDTTGVNRTEVTGLNRVEVTGADRALVVGARRAQRVRKTSTERIEGLHARLVGKDLDEVVKGKRRERVEEALHTRVKKDRRQQIDGTQSLTVLEDRHEKVAGTHALAAGKAVSLVAGEDLVGEGDKAVTVKGPGGFLQIDSAGVTIKGTLVKINAGGSAGKGEGPKAEAPEEAVEAVVPVPPGVG
ncbi:type VI secretion system Vgr family protein [Sorangium sp. So ce128]|uniref:type VI secretion system Vgr family protein n=1 Tax=Sorangium sp. So ce128 TaxID=3133281 RepID=UPI003F5DFD22